MLSQLIFIVVVQGAEVQRYQTAESLASFLYLDNRGRLSTSHAFIQLIDGLGQVLGQLSESLAVPVVVLVSEWLQDREGNAIEPWLSIRWGRSRCGWCGPTVHPRTGCCLADVVLVVKAEML